MSKYSPWFPPEVKPVRKGVYQVKDIDSLFPEYRWFAFWNGKSFGHRCIDCNRAYRNRDFFTTRRGLTTWRGLARNPK